jgi:hypothetical protein
MTAAVVSTVHTTVRTLTPTSITVPGPLWGVFSVILKVSSLWRWYRKAEIYTNPKNFQQLVAGHVVNFAFGGSVVLRVAAQCILIAHRILSCVEQIGNVAGSYRSWVNAITGGSLTNKKVKWDKGTEESSSCCSPSSTQWWKSVFNNTIDRIKAIAVTTFTMFKELFVLSMTFMDAIESFSMSPETRNESINEIFVNGTEFLDKMEKQQDLLVDCLYENKNTVTSILKGIGSSFTAEQLIDGASKGLETAKTVNRVVNVGNDFIKRAISGFYTGIGQTESKPTWVKVDPTVPWDKPGMNSSSHEGSYPISASTKKMQAKWKGTLTSV